MDKAGFLEMVTMLYILFEIVDTLQLNLCPRSFLSRLRRKHNSTNHQLAVINTVDSIGA